MEADELSLDPSSEAVKLLFLVWESDGEVSCFRAPKLMQIKIKMQSPFKF